MEKLNKKIATVTAKKEKYESAVKMLESGACPQNTLVDALIGAYRMKIAELKHEIACGLVLREIFTAE